MCQSSDTGTLNWNMTNRYQVKMSASLVLHKTIPLYVQVSAYFCPQTQSVNIKIMVCAP